MSSKAPAGFFGQTCVCVCHLLKPVLSKLESVLNCGVCFFFLGGGITKVKVTPTCPDAPNGWYTYLANG